MPSSRARIAAATARAARTTSRVSPFGSYSRERGKLSRLSARPWASAASAADPSSSSAVPDGAVSARSSVSISPRRKAIVRAVTAIWQTLRMNDTARVSTTIPVIEATTVLTCTKPASGVTTPIPIVLMVEPEKAITSTTSTGAPSGPVSRPIASPNTSDHPPHSSTIQTSATAIRLVGPLQPDSGRGSIRTTRPATVAVRAAIGPERRRLTVVTRKSSIASTMTAPPSRVRTPRPPMATSFR